MLERYRRRRDEIRVTHKNVTFDRLPDHWYWYFPGMAFRYWRHRLRHWTVLPDDRFWSIRRDVHGIVRAVKHDHVVMEIASGQFVHCYPGWPDWSPPNVVRSYEKVLRSDMWGWLPGA